MSGERYTIRLEEIPDAFVCYGDETVIVAMERAVSRGYAARDSQRIPIGCRRGGCGVCRVQVLDGPYRVEAMSRTHVTGKDETEGYVLACRLIPKGDLTLRLAPRQVQRKSINPNNI